MSFMASNGTSLLWTNIQIKSSQARSPSLNCERIGTLLHNALSPMPSSLSEEPSVPPAFPPPPVAATAAVSGALGGSALGGGCVGGEAKGKGQVKGAGTGDFFFLCRTRGAESGGCWGVEAR